MKKGILFVLALSLSALVGCGGTYKVPTSEFEKVKTAFNGVEKSFKKIANTKNINNNRGLMPRYKNIENGLSSIFSHFNSDDIKGHSIEDLSYNEPPMAQFQYLKAVFDKVGSGFEFGTKYYDNIVGDIYVDFETGFKAEKKDEYKYAYNYGLAIDINIDSNDLINADVSFDITLSKNGQNYNTKWYVNLLLDYDMENSSPTYTLTMLTENDEKELPFYNRFTYEYDYVDVENSKIDEWRKFCMDSSERLVVDNEHQTFEDYIDKNNITYKVDYPKWFKNDNYYKLTEMPESIQRSIGNAMYADLGLNAGDINADPFLAKQGTQNKVIQDIYKSFSKIYGDDLIYDLVCRDEDDYDPNQNKVRPSGIRAMAGADTGAENLPVGGDMQIGNLFNGYIDPLGEKHVVELWYCDENNNNLSRIENYRDLTYQFTTSINESGSEIYIPVEVSLDTTIKEAYALLKRLNGFGNYSRQIILLITDSEQVMGGVSLSYVGEFDDNGGNNQTATWPTEWSNYNIPEYKGDKVKYKFDRDGEHFWLYISNSNLDEGDNYVSILKSNGFEISSSDSLYNTTWKRKHSSTEMLMLKFDYTKEEYLIEAWTEQIDNSGEDNPGDDNPGDDNGNEEQQTLFINSLCLYGSFNDWGASVTSTHVFKQRSENAFALYQFAVEPGDKFKIVANSDWVIHNPETAYGGFGYDDFDNIKEYAEYLQKDDDKDANIIVKQYCEISIEAQNNGTHLGFKIFVKPTGPKQ